MAIKHAKQGKLIVFEGPDGVGKTTISREIAKYLNEHGEKCELMTFPGKEPGTIGNLVYDIHHNPSTYGIESLAPISKQALHIVAHLDAIERRISPSLKEGQHVLLDRFWWSTWVYGVVSGIDRRILKSMINLELAQWNGLKPAAAILLRRTAPIDRDDAPGYWKLLGQQYDVLARKERQQYPVFTIDNIGTLQETVGRVKEILKQKIPSLSRKRPFTKKAEVAQLSFLDVVDASSVSSITVHSHLLPARPTIVFDTYWRFAAERQKIFFKKLENAPRPWTDDRILASHKFTNAYRASDRVSQYLIRHVIYRDDLPHSADEVFFRIILFKIFNKIETWQLLEKTVGVITYSDYAFKHYDEALSRAMREGQAIYSAAYIMPSGSSGLGHDKKHRNHLKLIERMMADDLPMKLADSPNMHRGFDLLRAYPTIGDFLAYQFITDVNYSEITDFTEMEFVVPGPGALDGIRKCFLDRGGLNEPEIIRFMADIQEAEFERLGLDFQSLWGRRLQLIDCQNLFCEVDKYSRVMHPDIAGISGRTRIKQKYSAKPDLIDYWYPPKWGINQVIEHSLIGSTSLEFGREDEYEFSNISGPSVEN
jgi:thymidylate kinase